VRSLVEDALALPDPWKSATRMYDTVRPAAAHVAFLMVNQLAHGWDLAVATGQHASIPEDLAALGEPCARELLETTPILRTLFDDAIPAADDAPPSTRVLAYLGREASFAPPTDGRDAVG
jgi:uncharacterized protein (TIGR03086 family)